MLDSSKIKYAKRRLRRNYTGPDLISGSLTTDKYYKISTYVIGDDFTNVGAPSNDKDVIFKATGTTPAIWTGSSILNLIDLDRLKNDADIVFESAVDPVTLTSANFEGGAGTGQLTFPQDVLGYALEELILEFDPAAEQTLRPMGVRASIW